MIKYAVTATPNLNLTARMASDMLTTAPNADMIAEWKRIFEIHHSTLTPNRKAGNEADQYLGEVSVRD